MTDTEIDAVSADRIARLEALYKETFEATDVDFDVSDDDLSVTLVWDTDDDRVIEPKFAVEALTNAFSDAKKVRANTDDGTTTLEVRVPMPFAAPLHESDQPADAAEPDDVALGHAEADEIPAEADALSEGSDGGVEAEEEE